MRRRANLNLGPIAARCGCVLLLVAATSLLLLLLVLIPLLGVIFE